ncbi:MAG TPA: hypothetical protein VFI14_03935 [Chryseosolibacter sp.]|nr:hypothetical protein [Chryseosolibacter sp.]
MNGLSRLVKALWLFISGIVAVAAVYYLLTGVEQGIDVVIQSGESIDLGVLTILAVFLWAFLVWYSSRTLSYIKQYKDDEIFSKKADGDMTSAMLYEKYCIPAAFHMHIPRLLAYNCFVSIQVAIFHLPTFYGWDRVTMLAAVVAHNAFYFLLNAWFRADEESKRRDMPGTLSAAIIAGYVVFVLYTMGKGAVHTNLTAGPFRHTFWLSLIALTMFLLQVLSVIFFILRRARIDARRNDPSLKPSPLLDVIGYNPVFNAAEAPYFNLLNATAGVAVVVYLLAIFVMPFASLMGPMAFTLLALGVLTGLSNLITLVSIRISFNVVIVVIALAFLFGEWRDPYTVRFVTRDDGATFADRPDTRTYLRKWFARRIQMTDESDTASSFPVYIVLSNGGASRAGKWTSSVLSQLQDTSFQQNPGDSFKDHVLCIAGASGGSVGNCAFYSLLKASASGEISGDEFSQHTDAFFHTDFLTFTLARLLGPDMFRHLIPFNIPLDNRADALEDVIARGSPDALLSRYFQKPVSEIFDTTGTLPVLFINTTQVDNGMPGVISTVRLPEYSQRQDVLALVDSVGAHDGTGDLRLSTAAVLSSRFPYVSPAGKVFDRYYVDGGYFDNSGAGAVLEFIHALNRLMADTTDSGMARYANRFTFHILHLTNSEIVSRPSHDIHPLTNDLLAPVLTLAGMQGSSTSIGDGLLVNAFRQVNRDTADAMIVYSLYDETWDPAKNMGEFEEGYPMSWSLSDYQLYRMDIALKRASQSNLLKFGFGMRKKAPPLAGK